MLVLVSFVLVLAAAVTLVVGLLQSGLTLIYLSIGCSVLAGVVLAVAVLRGRPEPKAAAPIGRPFTPPASAPPVPASVGAPASSATETTSFTPPPPAPPTPSPTPTPPARGVSDDAATKAAGTALLGRLRGRRSEEPPVDATPEPEPVSAPEPVTMEMAAVSAEADDDFPIADYDKLRATDLLRRLGSLDRNQLEAVRERETAGKNRFTILSRVDVLLAAQAEPAWEVGDDEWEPDGDIAPSDAAVIPVGPVADDDDDKVAAGEIEDDEADEVDVDQRDEVDLHEVDELVSPVDEFPIADYDSLTVGQILPRLSDLNADELAQVRDREQQGLARGTILDRIERLAAKSGAMAMRASASPARRSPATRKAPARKAPVRKAATAIPVPPAATTTPAKQAVKKAPGPVTKSPGRRKAAPPVAPASPAAPTKEAVRKATAKKAPAAPAKRAEVAPAKSPGRRKAVAPVVPAETAAPTKAAVKKARATKATKRP